MSDHEIDWVPVDTFGARLALVRQALGWNYVQAAEACDLNDASWRNWEKGGSCREMENVARKISAKTGVSYGWLMSGGSLVTPTIRYAPSGAFTQLALVLPAD